MEKRKVVFGSYDTALEGAWTVAGLELSGPAFQYNLVSIPGRDGPLDLSTALTGEPWYQERTLTVVLELSDGDRAYREAQIRKIVNQLDGLSHQIWLPDDPDHYLQGRTKVVRNYNDLAHASVTVSAICDPWLYSNFETVHTLEVTAKAQNVTLVNFGRRTVVPEVVVDTADTVRLVCGGITWELTAGTYALPDLVLRPGELQLTYSGTGTITISYREAVLL